MKIEKKENEKIIAEVEIDGNQIDHVWVDENHRRQGIAWDLMQEAMAEIKKEGYDKIVVVAMYDTVIGIENLVSFYEDLGFEAIDSPASNVIMEMDV